MCMLLCIHATTCNNIIIGKHDCYKLTGKSCITRQTVYTQMLIHLADQEQRNPLLLVTSGNYQDGG